MTDNVAAEVDSPNTRCGAARKSLRVLKPVYLCGPINGRTTDDCNNWREVAKVMLAPLETLDPMRRDYRGRESEPGIAQTIVEGDVEDIRASGALLVMFDRPSVGTAMEVRMADAELGLPVHVVNISDRPLSPWMVYHAFAIHETLADACTAIRRSEKDAVLQP